jgi:iron(III) transport system ATP-binding protein
VFGGFAMATSSLAGASGVVAQPQAVAGTEVRVYLRPEDILARPIAPSDPYVFEGCIEKIEFLGSFCHVHIAAAAFPQPVVVYLSLNFLSEQSLQVGSRLPLKLLPKRIKVF